MHVKSVKFSKKAFTHTACAGLLNENDFSHENRQSKTFTSGEKTTRMNQITE